MYQLQDFIFPINMYNLEGLNQFFSICRNLNHNQLQGNMTDVFSSLYSLTTL
jgi:hypothetical protein